MYLDEGVTRYVSSSSVSQTFMEIRSENLEEFFNLYTIFGFQNLCSFKILSSCPGFVQDRINFLTVALRGQSLEPCGYG